MLMSAENSWELSAEHLSTGTLMDFNGVYAMSYRKFNAYTHVLQKSACWWVLRMTIQCTREICRIWLVWCEICMVLHVWNTNLDCWELIKPMECTHQMFRLCVWNGNRIRVENCNLAVCNHVAVCCRVLRCVADCCSVLQIIAACQRAEDCNEAMCNMVLCAIMLQCVAACCSVLQSGYAMGPCVITQQKRAFFCSVLHRVAAFRRQCHVITK